MGTEVRHRPAAGEPAPADEPESAFLRACRGLGTAHTPVWFMRQAGRFLPAFQRLSAGRSLRDLMYEPELAAQATLQPVEELDVDAAILFSDILPPLTGMGLRVELGASGGPAIENPLRRTYDIDMLATPPAEEGLSFALEATRIASHELTSSGIPLIGFGGAPFTMAAYAIEGGPSRDFARTKALMLREPAAWKRLMTKLVTVEADFLTKQVQYGAAALQVFDSWVGIALGREDYLRYVQPYNRMLFTALERSDVPTIHFSNGTAAYIEHVAEAGGDVLSVDWRMPLEWYWPRIEYAQPIQGNLDPAALLASWRELEYRAGEILNMASGRPGHIFNLGHGVLPDTPVETVKRLVQFVHARTAH